MDIFDKCYEFSRAEEVMAAGLYPYFTPISEAKGNRVKVRGREMIMIGSNNYLGLIDHPKVMQAAKEAIDRYGVATCGSRFLTGTIDLHEILEDRLARFMNKEAAVTFSTGYQTNLGIISSLAGKDDVVITDRMDHASIIDACRLSKAEVKKFRHNDLRDLERVLSEISDGKGKLIVVDGVFSMEGDIADLPGIVPLAKKYKARVMVDDAHGLGVLGEHGRGTAEHFGLEEEVDLVMGTFSKSFVSIGGFVVGKKKVVSYIKHHARSLIFSAAATPASVAAVLAALEVIETEPERRERLWQVTNFMRESFQKLGFNTGPSQTPIIPILIGDDEKCFAMWKTLRDEGIFTTPVIHPAVPHGQALIRTSYSTNHTDEELRLVLEAFEKCGRALGIIP
ncbi:MAG: pyridoxal phosphate-dependent aminotransferase family protein [Candidatus Saccharicenans sp.]|nr:pyridoxal phosphate-dependent aminotransferase family protein [Candidatus Saccharicenans sp.]MDI6848622.1 pyridoxal phosphate-dependent aminotransferase family protein [Candidatus Saccharicenans sp.]